MSCGRKNTSRRVCRFRRCAKYSLEQTLEKTKEAIVEAEFFVLLDGPVVALQGVVRQRHAGRNGGVRPVFIAASGTGLLLHQAQNSGLSTIFFCEIISVREHVWIG